MPEQVIDLAQAGELRAELGPASTVAFMRQALEEARSLLLQLPEGDGARLRPMIHSALGAAAMTGLDGLRHALIALQVQVRCGEDGNRDPTRLAQVLVQTETAISGWAATG